jgi:hypothetical protein
MIHVFLAEFLGLSVAMITHFDCAGVENLALLLTRVILHLLVCFFLPCL